MQEINSKWRGIWRTRNGTLVHIADMAFDAETIAGKIIESNIVSLWNFKTGDNLGNPDLDLVTKKRDEELW